MGGVWRTGGSEFNKQEQLKKVKLLTEWLGRAETISKLKGLEH